MLSVVLNFGLVCYILKSVLGMEVFNVEFGCMNVLSWFVILLLSMVIFMVILWKLIGGIGKLIGFMIDEIFCSKEIGKV